MADIIEWISRNKDWLFSGAAFAVMGGVIAAYKHFKKLPLQRITQTSPGQIVQIQIPEKSAGENTDITHITPFHIYDSISKLPLLQQDLSLGHYDGISVSWSGKLVAASLWDKENNEIEVLLEMPSPLTGSCYIRFVVPRSKYPWLAIVHKGIPINVKGVIEKVRSRQINLSDVELTISGANSSS